MTKLPRNNEAEQAILGSCLIAPDVVPLILESLTVGDFYASKHKEVFKAIQTLYLKKSDIDFMTVSSLLPKEFIPEIAGMIDNTPTARSWKSYAKILQNQTMRRRLINEAIMIQELAGDSGTDIDEVLLNSQKAILGLSLTKETPLKTTKELAIGLYQKIESGNHSIFQGVRTGFNRLDWILGGMKPGKLYILAGRPRMGKTALAKNIAEYVSIKSGPVFIASLEMDAEQLAIRHISGLGKIDGSKFNTGRFGDNDWNGLTLAAGKYSEMPIFYDDSGFQTDMGIMAKARKIKAEHGLSLLIIDYLQLVKASTKTNSREEYVASISRNLKGISKELQVPILCLAQLNRECEREKRKPMLSDLRESGGIEQDADSVMFVHRDYEYNPESPEHQGEVIIAKNRDGGTGTIELVWNGEHTNFYNKEG